MARILAKHGNSESLDRDAFRLALQELHKAFQGRRPGSSPIQLLVEDTVYLIILYVIVLYYNMLHYLMLY